MSDDYTAFLKKLSEIEAAVEETESVGIELPPLVAKELYCGVVCYMKANEEFSQWNEDEAGEELHRALKHMCQALFAIRKFCFLFYSEFARSAIDELKKHEKTASRYILNYDEQSKDFPEVIKLIESIKLPSETSPESQDACEDIIKKLQAFLSNFKTGKGKLFPTKNAEPKIDFSGMPNNYDKLKKELFKNFKETEEIVAHEKLSLPLAKELYYVVRYYTKADESLFRGNEKQAIEEMKNAAYHSRWALFNTMKLRLLLCLQESSVACAKFKGYKELALFHISNYSEHSKNLHTIREDIENKKWPDEDPSEDQDSYKSAQKLQNFLSDFKKDEGKLLSAIRTEKIAWRKFLIRVAGVVVAGGWGCSYLIDGLFKFLYKILT